jgi:hypothetical protein
MPPTFLEIKIYFLQKGLCESHAMKFFQHFEKRAWKGTTGIFYKSWKPIAYKWVMRTFRKEPMLFEKNVF